MTDCIFCRIAAGTIPAQVIARNERAMAIRDVNPQAPVHVLVIPVAHVGGVNDVDDARGGEVWPDLLALAATVARDEGIAESGYRLVVNSGADGGQSVAHLHLHVLGGRRMAWPPG